MGIILIITGLFSLGSQLFLEKEGIKKYLVILGIISFLGFGYLAYLDSKTITSLGNDLTTATPFLVNTLAILVGAYLAYFLGLKRYLKQRKSERIRETYIMGGIGRVIESTDQLSTACLLNYAKLKMAFDILKEDTDDPERSRDVVTQIFSEMEGVKSMPDYGIIKMSLFEVGIVPPITQMWLEFQLLNENIRHIGKQIVYEYFDGQQSKTVKERGKFLSEQEKVVWKAWEEVVQKYQPLKGYLLCLLIETDKVDLLNIEDIEQIQNQPGIKKLLKDIKNTYKDIPRQLVDLKDTQGLSS